VAFFRARRVPSPGESSKRSALHRHPRGRPVDEQLATWIKQAAPSRLTADPGAMVDPTLGQKHEKVRRESRPVGIRTDLEKIAELRDWRENLVECASSSGNRPGRRRG
jgi:hypothetical protein